MCMGLMWGEERAKKLIKEAGFKDENVQVRGPSFTYNYLINQIIEPSFFPANIVYLCRKE